MDSQKEALLANRVLLLLAAHKTDAAASGFQGLVGRFPQYPRLPLLQAALLAQAGKVLLALGQAACNKEAALSSHLSASRPLVVRRL